MKKVLLTITKEIEDKFGHTEIKDLWDKDITIKDVGEIFALALLGYTKVSGFNKEQFTELMLHFIDIIYK